MLFEIINTLIKEIKLSYEKDTDLIDRKILESKLNQILNEISIFMYPQQPNQNDDFMIRYDSAIARGVNPPYPASIHMIRGIDVESEIIDNPIASEVVFGSNIVNDGQAKPVL